MVAYLHISKKDTTKLESKTIKFIFLKYDIQIKVYRLFISIHYKIQISQDVVFDKILITFEYVKKNAISIVKVDIFSKLKLSIEDVIDTL